MGRVSRVMRMGNDTPLDGTNHVPTQPRRLAGMASALVAVCLVATASITACGKDNEADARPRRTTTTERETTTATQNPEEAEKQAVIAASDAAAQVRRESAAPPTPNPDHPQLPVTHTGAMLEQWRGSLNALQFNGTAIRYPENSVQQVHVDSVNIEELDGQHIAHVELCVVDDGERVSVVTDAVLSGGVKTSQLTETMVKEDGVWKVSEIVEISRLEGVTGCAVD